MPVNQKLKSIGAGCIDSSMLFLIFLFFSTHDALAQHQTQATMKDLNGIVAAFRCSGSLVSLGQADDEAGLILSAGHCSADDPDVGYPVGRASVQVPIYSRDEYASYYRKTSDQAPITLGNFQLASIFYGTMSNEDVTLFQTVPNLGALKALGIRIYSIADQLPVVGQRLQVTSGLWGQSQTCSVEKILPNNAAEQAVLGTSPAPLEMRDTILLDQQCAAKEGWSGSPLVDLETGLIYGVLSRVDSSRVLASSVVELRRCVTNGKLNFKAAGCGLPER